MKNRRNKNEAGNEAGNETKKKKGYSQETIEFISRTESEIQKINNEIAALTGENKFLDGYIATWDRWGVEFPPIKDPAEYLRQCYGA